MKLSSQQIASQILKQVSNQNSTHTQKGLNRLSALLHKMPKSQKSSLLNQLSDDPLDLHQQTADSSDTVSLSATSLSKISSETPDVDSRPRDIPFHHLSFLDSADFQKVFEGLSRTTWLKALKIAEPEFKDFVLSNISVRIRGDVEEELAYLGPVRLGDAQDAQIQIIEYAKTLEEQGKIAQLEEEDSPWLDEA